MKKIIISILSIFYYQRGLFRQKQLKFVLIKTHGTLLLFRKMVLLWEFMLISLKRP
ncbi:MAG: hypothetical protein ACI86H_002398 [bacterium]|jgi:hypothetical protein